MTDLPEKEFDSDVTLQFPNPVKISGATVVSSERIVYHLEIENIIIATRPCFGVILVGVGKSGNGNEVKEQAVWERE